MYLQGAGGDVSPAGTGGVAPPTAEGEPFYNFARAESVGVAAAPTLRAAWERAGKEMRDALALEAVTRSVELGPDAATFTVRGGDLAYAPFVAERDCDREIFGDGGEVLSPIDEFNAPVGAGLCGSGDDPLVPGSGMWNTDGLAPFGSCSRLDAAGELLGPLLGLDFGEAPLCSSTRTTVSAVRLGEHVIATLPGEPLTLLADRVRGASPLEPDRTIVIGYAQGHVGYLLTAEDWLLGGYEPSINSWGPLEGEYLAERAGELLALVDSDEREDASSGGADRVASPEVDDADVPAPDPAPLAGTVPDPLFASLYVRNRVVLDGAQPAATIERVAGVARFVWIGEDPLAGTPRVILQRETDGGFADVARGDGRAVTDGDILLYWTPEPLARAAGEARTHHWIAEWQAVAVDGDLEDRAGLPLGRYRFHVAGTGYAVDSDPFEVVAGPIDVAVSILGRNVSIDAAYAAPEGWRLLDHVGSSNESVVVRRGPFAVVLEYGDGSSESFPSVEPIVVGRVEVTARAGATVNAVVLTDRFGNSGRRAIDPTALSRRRGGSRPARSLPGR
jgi:neutral ceramidase